MLYSPFFTQKYPELKSKICLCAESTDYFIEEERKIEKSFIIKPDDDSYYLSTFTTGHLFY
jgi:hypothetical protein